MAAPRRVAESSAPKKKAKRKPDRVQPKQVGSVFGLPDAGDPFGFGSGKGKGTTKNVPSLTEQVALARARKQRLAQGGLLSEPQRSAEQAAARIVATKTAFAKPPPQAAPARRVARETQSAARPTTSLAGRYGAVPTPKATHDGGLGDVWGALQGPLIGKRAASAVGEHVLGPAARIGQYGVGTTAAVALAGLGIGSPEILTRSALKKKSYVTPEEPLARIARAGLKTPDISIPIGDLSFEGTAYAGGPPNARVPFKDLAGQTGWSLKPAAAAKLVKTAHEVQGWNYSDLENLSATDLIYRAYNKPPGLLTSIAKGIASDVVMGGSQTVGAVGLLSEAAQGRGLAAAKEVGSQFKGVLPGLAPHPAGDVLRTHPLFAATALHAGLKTAGAVGHLRPGLPGERSVTLPIGEGETISRGPHSKNLWTAAGQEISDFSAARNPRHAQRIVAKHVVDEHVRQQRNVHAQEHSEVQVPKKRSLSTLKDSRQVELLAWLDQGGDVGLRNGIEHYRGEVRNGNPAAQRMVDLLERAHENGPKTDKEHAFVDSERAIAEHTSSVYGPEGDVPIFRAETIKYRKYETPIEMAASLEDPLALTAKAARQNLEELQNRGDTGVTPARAAKVAEVGRDVTRHGKKAAATEKRVREQQAKLKAWRETGTEIRARRPPPPGKASTTSKDFEGQVGNNQHITRNEQGPVPTSALADLAGVKGEKPGAHVNKQGEEWTKFVEDVKKNGVKEPIFITIDHNGKPLISEGTHRRDAAIEAGLTHVPVEIRYYGHAEKQGSLTERAAQPKIEAPKGKPKTTLIGTFATRNDALRANIAEIKLRRKSDPKATGSVRETPDGKWEAHVTAPLAKAAPPKKAAPGTTSMAKHRAAVKEWKAEYAAHNAAKPKVTGVARAGGRQAAHETEVAQQGKRLDKLTEAQREALPYDEQVALARAEYSAATDAFIARHHELGGVESAYVERTPLKSGISHPSRLAGKQRFTVKMARKYRSTGTAVTRGEFVYDPKASLRANLEAQRVRQHVGIWNALAKHPMVHRVMGDGELTVGPGQVALPLDNFRSAAKTAPKWNDSVPVSAHDVSREHGMREKFVDAFKGKAATEGEVIPAGQEVFLVPEGMHDRIIEWATPTERKGKMAAYDRANAAYQRLLIGLYPSTWLGNAPGSIPLAISSGALPGSGAFRKAAQSGKSGPLSRRLGYEKHPELAPASLSGMGAAGNTRAPGANPVDRSLGAMRELSMLGEDFTSRAAYFGQAKPYVEGRIPTLRKMIPALDKIMPERWKGVAAELNVDAGTVYRALAKGEFEGGVPLSPKVKAAQERMINHAEAFAGASLKPMGGLGKGIGRVILFHNWIGHILKLTMVTLPVHHPRRAALLNAVSMYGNEYRQEHGVYPTWMYQFFPALKWQENLGGKLTPGVISLGSGQLTPMSAATNLATASSGIVDASDPIAMAAGVTSPLLKPFADAVVQLGKNRTNKAYDPDYSALKVLAAGLTYAAPGLAKFAPRGGYTPGSSPLTGMTKKKYYEYVPSASNRSYRRYEIPWEQRAGGRSWGGTLGRLSRIGGVPIEWNPTGGIPLKVEQSNQDVIQRVREVQRETKKPKR